MAILLGFSSFWQVGKAAFLVYFYFMNLNTDVTFMPLEVLTEAQGG